MKRYQIVIIKSAWPRLRVLAGMVYGGPIQPHKLSKPISESDSLSVVRKNRDEKMIKTSILLLLASALIGVQGASTATAVNQADHLKLYAHSRIVDWEQFQCFNSIIRKESRWSVTARNGSHYGLGQMRNVKYKTLDGYSQIDWTIRYILKRYGSACKAWTFHQEENWY